MTRPDTGHYCISFLPEARGVRCSHEKVKTKHGSRPQDNQVVEMYRWSCYRIQGEDESEIRRA